MKNYTKRFLAVTCSALLCMQYATAYTVASAVNFMTINTTSFDDDPEKFKYIENTDFLAQATQSTEADSETEEPTEPPKEPKPTCLEEIVHDKNVKEYNLIEGIDVSKWQPIIDWEAVKADGIDFAIIRIGYRGYGEKGTLIVDPCFESHIQGAQEAGLDVGVYFFTQATNEEEAIEEANLILETLEGYELELPVYFDIESITHDVGRLDSAKLTVEEHTANCVAFCETIINGGYQAGVYGNKYWLEEKLDSKYLETEYPVWLARYNKEPEYKGEYQTWQYTEKGTVDGINGNVDKNCYYERKLEFAEKQLIVRTPDTFIPDVYGEHAYKFTSSDTNIIKVDNYGALKPVKNGTATITVTSEKDGSTDTLEVIVVAFTQVALSENTLKFDGIGVQSKLTAVKSKSGVTWKSTEPSVITIEDDGTIETVGYGSALIIATNSLGNIGLCEIDVVSNLVGDCDNDGAITALDAAELLCFAAKNSVSAETEISDEIMKRYDVNEDGAINSKDAAAVLVMSAEAACK